MNNVVVGKVMKRQIYSVGEWADNGTVVITNVGFKVNDENDDTNDENYNETKLRKRLRKRLRNIQRFHHEPDHDTHYKNSCEHITKTMTT